MTPEELKTLRLLRDRAHNRAAKALDIVTSRTDDVARQISIEATCTMIMLDEMLPLFDRIESTLKALFTALVTAQTIADTCAIETLRAECIEASDPQSGLTWLDLRAATGISDMLLYALERGLVTPHATLPQVFSIPTDQL